MEKQIDLAIDRKTREQIREKSYASRYAALIINSLSEVIQFSNNKRLQSRLARKLYDIAQTDLITQKGKRVAERGIFSELEGFEFNLNATFSSIFFGFFKTNIVRSQGKVCFKLNSFLPSSQIAAPAEATHFEIVSGVCEIKSITETFQSKLIYSKLYDLKDRSTGDIFFIHKIATKSNFPLLLVLGLNFYSSNNGIKEKFDGGEANCLMIIAADNKNSHKRNGFEKSIQI